MDVGIDMCAVDLRQGCLNSRVMRTMGMYLDHRAVRVRGLNRLLAAYSVRGHVKVPTYGQQEVPTPRPILTTG